MRQLRKKTGQTFSCELSAKTPLGHRAAESSHGFLLASCAQSVTESDANNLFAISSLGKPWAKILNLNKKKDPTPSFTKLRRSQSLKPKLQLLFYPMARRSMARGSRLLCLLAIAALRAAFVVPRGLAPRPRHVARRAEPELKARDEGGDALGAVGIGASLVMAWSEWTLKTTGPGGF